MSFTKKVKKGTTASWLIREIEGTNSATHLFSLKATILSE